MSIQRKMKFLYRAVLVTSGLILLTIVFALIEIHVNTLQQKHRHIEANDPCH